MIDYCGSESSTLCFLNLGLFIAPFLWIIGIYCIKSTSSNISRSISVVELFFGKYSSENEGKKIKIISWLDLTRILLSLSVGLLPLLGLSLEKFPTSGKDSGGTDLGFHVFTDALIFNGLVPQLLFVRLLILEISSASKESFHLRMFQILSLFSQIFKLVLLFDFYNSLLSLQVTIFLSLELILKLITSIVVLCINRDVQKLHEKFIALGFTELEPLLSSTNSDFESSFSKTPEEYSGYLSILTFHWMNKLIKTGYTRPLVETDFYALKSSDQTSKLSSSFISNLNDQILKSDRKNLNYWIIIKAWHNSGILSLFYQAALLKLIYNTLNFIPPLLMKSIISLVSSETASTSSGLLLVVILFISSAIQTVILHQYFHKVYRTSLRVRSSLLCAIYLKSLKLSLNSRSSQNLGQIVNLMSTDSSRLQNLFPYLHNSWSALYVIFLSTLFLWYEISYAVIIALVFVIFLIIPLTSFISRKIKLAQKEVMRVKDDRIQLITEVIQQIKIIKLYGWERSFRNQVTEVRAHELSKLATYLRWRVLASFVWPITPIVMSLSSFATFTILMKQTLTAATAFTSLSLLNLLRFPLAMFPNVINSIVEATVSLKRIADFLISEEIDQKLITNGDQLQRDVINELPALKALGDFFWDDYCEKIALKGLHLEIKKGEICVVTGKVGSGKSALLKLFINDLTTHQENELNSEQIKRGHVEVNGSLAFANQVPWIQNASVRENILFGKPFEKQWYQKVVFSCALNSDFNQLPYGDETEIGERGINLSGGQKARIALARAVYSNHDILLLESCFEAVDEHVGDHIWNHCFMKLLKNKKKTVILVTHALKRLPFVDSIILMKDGEVLEKGSYAELVDSENEDFKDLLTALETQHKEVESKSETQNGNGTTLKIGTSDEVHGKDRAQSLVFNETKSKGKDVKERDLTGSEERGVGKVSKKVYQIYFTSSGGYVIISFIVLFYFFQTALNFATNRWLAEWSSSSTSSPSSTSAAGVSESAGFLELLTISQMHEMTYLTTNSAHYSTGFYLGIYAALSLLSMVFIISSLIVVLFAGFRASRLMHQKLLLSITRGRMSFFDTTPSGRILNRFSKDIYTVDEVLPGTMNSLLSTTFRVIGTFFSIAYVAPQFLIVVPFLAYIYRIIQKYYIANSRELKRWDSVLRSPIYSFFTETLEGTSTIRAFNRENDFLKQNQVQVSRNQRAYYLSVSANRWLAVRLEFVGTFFQVAAALSVVMSRGRINPGLAGLALTYAFSITQTLNWTVRMGSDLETNIVSVERLNEYIGTKSEAAEEREVDLSNWPSQGGIKFNKVQARYRDGLPLVLKNFDCEIKPGEKVGIVGRTGAGKSSLFLVLMRIVEPCAGSIQIDGLDLQNLGLIQLRQRIAIIPQDPLMFSGTVRNNLDPTNSFSDESIVHALKLCKIFNHLSTLVHKSDNVEGETTPMAFPELFVEFSEKGSNLSFGQKQLLCISRAVLRKCKILLLDEATSGIDLATDSLIQNTIRNQFKKQTVLTVAHRIETILGGDRVLVMEEGQIKEFDTPKNLLSNSKSHFSHLVETMKNGRSE